MALLKIIVPLQASFSSLWFGKPVAYVWVQTAGRWLWKRPLSQLCNSYYPTDKKLNKVIFGDQTLVVQLAVASNIRGPRFKFSHEQFYSVKWYFNILIIARSRNKVVKIKCRVIEYQQNALGSLSQLPLVSLSFFLSLTLSSPSISSSLSPSISFSLFLHLFLSIFHSISLSPSIPFSLYSFLPLSSYLSSSLSSYLSSSLSFYLSLSLSLYLS